MRYIRRHNAFWRAQIVPAPCISAGFLAGLAQQRMCKLRELRTPQLNESLFLRQHVLPEPGPLFVPQRAQRVQPGGTLCRHIACNRTYHQQH